MKTHVIQCRYCKEYFDTEPLKEGEDWIMPSQGWYYHTPCYKTFKNSGKKKSDETWHELIYDFIAHDLIKSYDYFLCEAQLKNFVNKEKKGTYKGVYFALKYFYEVKHGEWEKGNGGIGIVPYIYEDSKRYWLEIEKKKQGTIAAIEEQIRARAEQRTITKKKEKLQKNKKKPKWNLEEIE